MRLNFLGRFLQALLLMLAVVAGVGTLDAAGDGDFGRAFTLLVVGTMSWFAPLSNTFYEVWRNA